MVKDSKCTCNCTNNAEGKLLIANARIRQLENEVADLNKRLALSQFQYQIKSYNCSLQIERNIRLSRLVDYYRNKLAQCENVLHRLSEMLR